MHACNEEEWSQVWVKSLRIKRTPINQSPVDLVFADVEVVDLVVVVARDLEVVDVAVVAIDIVVAIDVVETESAACHTEIK